MILDEQLRLRVDLVSQRLRNVDRMAAITKATVASLLAYIVLRAVVGVFSGGQGGFASCLTAMAVGVTYILTRRRPRHTRLSAARFIDRELGLEDRLATAVERSGFGRGESNRVEQWLFADATRHASFINPRELVPYQAPVTSRWLFPLLTMALILSLPIYPTGLTWQLGSDEWQRTAEKAEELAALADQLERLALQQPELREVTDLLRTISEQLRDRRMPKSEALRLLHELEQEMQVATEAQGFDLDLTHIQHLAQRLRRINPAEMQGRDRLSRWLSPRGEKGGTRGDSEYDSRDPHVRADDTNGRGTPNTAHRSTQTASSGSGTDAQRANSGTEEQTGSGGYSMDSHHPIDDDDEFTAGSSAGVGHDKNRQDTAFERSVEITRELIPVTGTLGESGAMLTGKADGTMASTPQAVPRTGIKTSVIVPAGVEQAVNQEQIPLAYRHWIKRYFENLEPDQQLQGGWQ